MELRKEIQETKTGRRKLIISLVGVIIAANIIILLSPDQNSAEDFSRILAVGAASILSLIVIARQGVAGIFGKAYLAISVGIILWLAAETTWGYYELVLHIDKPFPSVADALWLAGYGPVGYHLFGMSRFYGRGIKKYKIAIVAAGIAIFSGLYIQQLITIFGGAPETTTLGLAISIAYPVLDAALFMPAIVIVWNAGRGHLTSIPWIFISWISLGIADTLLGIAAIQDFEGNLMIVNLFYITAYVGMAAGLWWYNRFFILDKKKVGVHPK
jgi:hypothetical protein